MTQLLKTLGRTALFRGLSEEEAEKALSCLGTQRRCYAKGEAVLRAGDHVGSIALVLSGSVCIENNDAWGNKSVLDRLGQGQVFAETYACSLVGRTGAAGCAATGAQSAFSVGAEEFDPFPAHVPYFGKNHPRTAPVLSLRSGGPPGPAGV